MGSCSPILQGSMCTRDFSACSKVPLRCFYADKLRNLTVFQPNNLNVSDVPKQPVKEDCVITNKCNLASNPECGKLRDRFLNIQAGIEEKKDQLSEKLVELEHFCEETRWSFESQ